MQTNKQQSSEEFKAAHVCQRSLFIPASQSDIVHISQVTLLVTTKVCHHNYIIIYVQSSSMNVPCAAILPRCLPESEALDPLCPSCNVLHARSKMNRHNLIPKSLL